MELAIKINHNSSVNYILIEYYRPRIRSRVFNAYDIFTLLFILITAGYYLQIAIRCDFGVCFFNNSNYLPV